jgi:signal transduction histidine kinase
VTRRRALRLALAAAGIGLGLASELLWSSLAFGLTAADFAVGAVLIGSGAFVWDRRVASRSGPLLTLAGFTWFAGNLGSALVYLHRGPVVHVALADGNGRVRGRIAPVVVAAAYVDALVAPIARNDVATLVLAGLVAAAAFASARGSASALAYAAVLATGAVDRLAGWGHEDAILVAYDVAVAAIAAARLVDLRRERSVRAVTGLIVDLGAGTDTIGLRAKLARALGDPSLVLGYRLPGGEAFVDDAGAAVVLPRAGSGRAVTPLEHRGELIGVLVHDESLPADRQLSESVAAAAQLALANVRLQTEARAQAAELERSRRRVVETIDRQRRRLEQQLRDGPERLLEDAASRLAAADTGGLAGLREELDAVRGELHEFAQGIRPTALSEGGVMPALALLAQRSPVPVRVTGAVGRLPEPVEATLYFVCSEALANAVKHAHGREISIEVQADDGLATVIVADDGVGGAWLGGGTGLRGLADRVEALGGRLELASPAGRGTRLRAEISLAPREPRPRRSRAAHAAS